MWPVYLRSLSCCFANCDSLLYFPFFKVILPCVFVFTNQICNRNCFWKTVSEQLIFFNIKLNTSQKLVIFKVLAIDYLTRNLTHNCNVGGIHKADVKERYGKACWNFTFDRLIAFLFQIIDLPNIFTLENKGFCDRLAVVLLVSLILTIAKYIVIHPSKTGHLVFVVEEL